MEWLNYHHLLYFWTVAREGTIARASEELRLAQPTISTQIAKLEEQAGMNYMDMNEVDMNMAIECDAEDCNAM